MLTRSPRSSKRLFERLETLFVIGGGVGADRPGLSLREQEACKVVAAWMGEAGLEVSWDDAGNLIGRLPGRDPGLAEVWTGSHLDSVPEGGRFDGALGVLGGLEAASALAAEGQLTRTIGVVAFRDEEGWRFGTGCFGSRALCGALEPGELNRRDREGTSRAGALAALQLPAARPQTLPGTFVELHVEQGPRLARAGVPLGVVTAIAGVARGEAVFLGERGHAGTTPMADRRDALVAAAGFVVALREAAGTIEDAVATAGQIVVDPGAANVIPQGAVVVVDARAPDTERFRALLAAIEHAAVGAGGSVRLARKEPVPLTGAAREALRRELEAAGVPFAELPSGAGHDAGILAAAGVPSAMLFVRNPTGVSHSPTERAEAADCHAGVDALTRVVQELA